MNEPPLGKVEYIQSFLPTSEYIRSTSVLEIQNTEDLLSPKLGVTDLEKACESCDSYMEECTGHNAHLEIPRFPCYRIFWVKRLIMFFNSICFYCQRLRMPSSDPYYEWILSQDPKNRLELWEKYSRIYKRCGKIDKQASERHASHFKHSSCGKLFCHFAREDRMWAFITVTIPLDTTDIDAFQMNGILPSTTITPMHLFQVAKCVSPQVKHLLGFNKWNDPSAMFWDVLPIPSLNTRPFHTFAGVKPDKKKQVLHNDWTNVLKSIVTARNVLMDAIVEHPEETIHLEMYSLGTIVSDNPLDCLTLYQISKNEKKDWTIKQKGLSHAGTKPIVESAWRNLNKLIAGFHSYKHRSYVKTSYGTQPVGVEERYKNQKAGRLRKDVVTKRVNNAVRGVLETSMYMKPTHIGVPKCRAMDLTFPEVVNRFNVKRLQRAILNGPFTYPGANYVTMKDGTEIDLMYYENRRSIQMNDVLSVRRHILDEVDIGLLNRQPSLHRNSHLGLKVKIVPGYVLIIHESALLSIGGDRDGDEVTLHIMQTMESRVEAIEICGVEHQILKDGNVWFKMIQNIVVGARFATLPTTKLSRITMLEMLKHVDSLWEYPKPDMGEDGWSGASIFSCILPRDFCMSYQGEHPLVIEMGVMKKNHVLHADNLNWIVNHMYRDYSDPSITVEFIYQCYLMFQAAIDSFGMTVGFYDCFVNDPDELTAERAKLTQLKTYVNGRFTDHHPKRGDADTEKNIQMHIEHVNKSFLDKITAYHKRKNPNNGLLLAIESGAKGSYSTFGVMTGNVGQVMLMSQRMDSMTSHFPRNEFTLEGCGYIAENYCCGIGLLGVLAESHAACESVVNKNKGTSRSGYIVRKMATCMMGVVIDRWQRVVDTSGRVLWDHYGDDNYDSTMLILSPIHCPYYSTPPIHENRKIKMPFSFEHLFMRCKHINQGCNGDVVLTENLVHEFRQGLWNRLVEHKLVLKNNHVWKNVFWEWFDPNVILNHLKFHKGHLAWLAYEIRSLLARSIVAPGESAGVKAVQDLGEDYVQKSLKTPHLSGKFRQMTADTARMAEIVDLNFHHPIMTIHLKRSKISTRQQAIEFGLSISRCYLSDIASDYPRIVEGENKIYIAIDKAKLIERQISLRLVARRLMCVLGSNITIQTSFMDDNTHFISFSIHEKSRLWEYVMKSQEGIVSSHAIIVGTFIHNLYYNMLIHGLEKIETFTVEKNAKGKWIMTTSGSDLATILNMPEVDTKHTISNDCLEMGNVLGLHAARISLEREFLACMSGSTDERHIQLIARKMSSDLRLTGMTIKQNGKSIPPLMRACFEQASKQMTDYCSLGEVDRGETVCAAALSNHLLRVGTGYQLDLIHSVDIVPQRIKTLDYCISPKVDGTRMHLILTQKNNIDTIALVPRSNEVYLLPTMGIFYKEAFFGTELDGDMIHDGQQRAIFIIYDCLASCGNMEVRNLRYDLRLEIAREVVYRLATHNQAIAFPSVNAIHYPEPYLPIQLRPMVSQCTTRVGTLPFDLHVKPIYALEESARLKSANFAFPIDGYVITALNLGASPFRNVKEAAWKWKSNHTIDVLLVRAEDAHCYEKLFEDTSLVNNRGQWAMISSDNKYVSMLTNVNGFTIQVYEVYECEWIGDEWKVMRKRDKQANNSETILATCKKHVTWNEFIRGFDICQ